MKDNWWGVWKISTWCRAWKIRWNSNEWQFQILKIPAASKFLREINIELWYWFWSIRATLVLISRKNEWQKILLIYTLCKCIGTQNSVNSELFFRVLCTVTFWKHLKHPNLQNDIGLTKFGPERAETNGSENSILVFSKLLSYALSNTSFREIVAKNNIMTKWNSNFTHLFDSLKTLVSTA